MDQRKLAKNILKAGVLMGTAGLMMGNQSCQQQPQGRQLKRIVEFKKVTSPALVLPGGETFDFEYVANQQIYAVLQKSEQFTLRYHPPIVNTPAPFGGEMKMLKVSPRDNVMMKAMAANSGFGEKVEYSKEAECMINLPNANVAGSINAFEMIGGVGVNAKVGFDASGAHKVGPLTGGGFSAEWAQLDLSLAAYSPMTKSLLAAANVNAKQTKTKISLSLLFGALSVGPSAYYNTPLSKVTHNALIKGVAGLHNDFQTKGHDWYSRVLVNHDTHLTVIGGTNVGMKVGDQFNVYNEDYYWEGTPCGKDSKYWGGLPNAPVAVIEIDLVGDEVSRGRVIKSGDANAVLGAKIKLLQFAADQSAPAPAAQK